MSQTKLTPMMQQYFSIKNQYKDCLLLYRLGDFYELFAEDAKVASKVLDITLTGRDAGLDERIPMCGVPHHAADSYIATLVKKGYKVAICEQVEDPKEAKGVVKREVVRVITPGTVIDQDILPHKANNYLAVLSWHQKTVGVASVDVSTGEFRVTEFSGSNGQQSLLTELERLRPAECLADPQLLEQRGIRDEIAKALGAAPAAYDSRAFHRDAAYRSLTQQFRVSSLMGFNLEDKPAAIKAAGALLSYLGETQMRSLSHISSVQYYLPDGFMAIDSSTRRNLELTETLRQGSFHGSLLWVLDDTQTAMGGRRLRQWVEMPLIDIEAIKSRQELVQALYEDTMLRATLRESLSQISDIERLCSKAVYGSANARELVLLRHSLQQLPAIYQVLKDSSSSPLRQVADQLDLLTDLTTLLEAALVDEPPISVREGGLIRPGYHAELDKLRELSIDGRRWVARLEQSERERTGIKSLKVGFNKVFGYYIEVTKANLDLVPENYHRKQTLANSERYITQELKEWESQILGAQERSVELEYELFVEVREKVSQAATRLLGTASVIAALDALCSLAQVAVDRNYVRPVLSPPGRIEIVGGRHPVVEAMLTGTRFVPNDVLLDRSHTQIMILTGPNMAGKSTYLRMVACIALLAQIGSFVPAESANIGLVDRIFTRVGASDDLGTGQSTFMVEMNEVMLALSQGTSRSLVIIDELGRGTSTYDGMALARAIAEYIHDHLGALTIFSTHYHELADLELSHHRVKNYRLEVLERGSDVIFLYKVARGRADKSYGIHVAKLAGLPRDVIHRAQAILEELETTQSFKQMDLGLLAEEAAATQEQESLGCSLTAAKRIVEELTALDLNRLTPLEAINLLAVWQALVNQE